jgi:hypothetical protein
VVICSVKDDGPICDCGVEFGPVKLCIDASVIRRSVDPGCFGMLVGISEDY